MRHLMLGHDDVKPNCHHNPCLTLGWKSWSPISGTCELGRLSVPSAACLVLSGAWPSGLLQPCTPALPGPTPWNHLDGGQRPGVAAPTFPDSCWSLEHWLQNGNSLSPDPYLSRIIVDSIHSVLSGCVVYWNNCLLCNGWLEDFHLCIQTSMDSVLTGCGWLEDFHLCIYKQT